MKFLFFYKYCDKYRFDHWFHLDLVDHFNKAGHISFAYGPKVHIGYSQNTLMAYSPGITMEELHKRFSFDAVILLTKSRMFEHYRPPLAFPIQGYEDKRGCWLPRDFNNWKGYKILIEEDYHYENSNEWYKEIGIDMVLQRHLVAVPKFKRLGDKGIKCFWYPFSVDEETFKSEGKVRELKLGMAASVVSNIYPCRQMLLNLLKRTSLLNKLAGTRIEEENYLDYLKTCISHANCSSIYHITAAKMFEIMSSGSILFTDEGDEYGLKELFYDNSYVSYARDGSNVIPLLTQIINEDQLARAISLKGRTCIINKHTHKIRIGELEELLKKEM